MLLFFNYKIQRADGENRTPVMRATVARSATELQPPLYKI